MKIIRNHTAKNFTKTITSTNTPFVFDKQIIVPLFSESAKDSMLIFLQNSKYVVGPAGVKSIALICTATNGAFTAKNGTHYMVVGRKFMKLSHKEQLAVITAEYMRNGMDTGYLAADLHLTKEEIIEHSAMMNSAVGGGQANALINEGAVTNAVLSGLFGKSTAKKVICREYKLTMKSSEPIAAEMAARSKETNNGYVAKEFKGEVKDAKKVNKTVIKSCDKADKNMADADAKAEKTAKKATKAEEKARKQPKKDDGGDVLGGIAADLA